MPGEIKEVANEVSGDVIAEEEEADDTVDDVSNVEANAITTSQAESEEREVTPGANEMCPKIVVVEPEEDTEKLDQPEGNHKLLWCTD